MEWFLLYSSHTTYSMIFSVVTKYNVTVYHKYVAIANYNKLQLYSSSKHGQSKPIYVYICVHHVVSVNCCSMLSSIIINPESHHYQNTHPFLNSLLLWHLLIILYATESHQKHVY